MYYSDKVNNRSNHDSRLEGGEYLAEKPCSSGDLHSYIKGTYDAKDTEKRKGPSWEVEATINGVVFSCYVFESSIDKKGYYAVLCLTYKANDDLVIEDYYSLTSDNNQFYLPKLEVIAQKIKNIAALDVFPSSTTVQRLLTRGAVDKKYSYSKRQHKMHVEYVFVVPGIKAHTLETSDKRSKHLQKKIGDAITKFNGLLQNELESRQKAKKKEENKAKFKEKVIELTGLSSWDIEYVRENACRVKIDITDLEFAKELGTLLKLHGVVK